MATLTAYMDGTGEELRSINISTGSANGARRVPAGFARWYFAHDTCVHLRVNVSSGPTGRTIVKRGNGFYTRVTVNERTSK